MRRFATAALAFSLVASSRAATDSAMFRGDPAHLGVFRSPAPPLAQVKWKFATTGKVFSTPALANGLVYVGSNDDYLYAIHASDGSLAWKYLANLGIASSPAVDNGVVYFSSVDGYIYALSADKGELKWKFRTEGERRYAAPGIHGIPPSHEMMPDPYDVFLSSPVIVNGRVYIGSGDHNVYAIDAAAGTLVWKYTTGDVVHASPAVVDGVVYIGSWDRYMYALDAGTGAMKWKFETGDDPKIHNQIGIASSAAVVDGIVLFGCRDGHFYAVNAKTGMKKWAEDNKGGWVIASPAVKDGVVYFPTADGQQVKAMTIATGAIVWRKINKAISFSSPAIAGDLVYVGSHDGFLRAFDMKTGDVRHEFQTDASKANAAKFLNADGSLNYKAMYLQPGIEGTFAGIDRMHLLGGVFSSPVIADGVVYFGATDGTIYAVK
jgi:outer membrane protein assembly factor BamB